MNHAWEYVTLDDAVKKGSSNISLNKIKDEKGDYPVFGAKGFAKNISFFQQDQEYLAIIKDGAGIGRISKYPKYSSVLATMQYLIPKEGFEIGFLEYFLKSIDFEKHRNGSTIPHIYFKDYKSELIPILSIAEQKRIVAILDLAFADIEKARANAEQNLKNARELFESYLQQVFSQRGDGWVEVKLKDAVTSVLTGPFGSMLHKSDYIEGGMPLVNPINIIGGVIVPNNSKTVSSEMVSRLKTYTLSSGDVVIGRRGEIGRCAVVEEEQHGWICGTGCFYIKPSKELNSYYLANLLRSPKYREALEETATGATMKNLSNTSLKNLMITFPAEVKEQLRILGSINKMRWNIDNLEKIYFSKLAALDELKKSILQKAFTGELTKKVAR